MDLKIQMPTKLQLPIPRERTALATMGAAIALILIGIVSGDSGLAGNLIIIAIFLVIIPTFLKRYTHFVWIKSLEDQFPNFVRDLADSVRSGMSFKEAISISSRGNYGKLTDEIVKMNNRLVWGTSVKRVFEIFSKTVKDSKLMSEALNIMREAQVSGGDVAATLDAIARDMITFKEIEAERRSMTRQHVMIMYGVFFMFLGIAIMIIFVMVPMIKTQPQTAVGGFGLEFSNPCEGLNTFPCDFFGALGAVFNMPPGITLYYTALFFTVVMIQGIFTGLLAGQLGENSILAGAKHSLIMVTVSLVLFLFIAKAGLFPV
jgi:flagellar protein FlaJ